MLLHLEILRLIYFFTFSSICSEFMQKHLLEYFFVWVGLDGYLYKIDDDYENVLDKGKKCTPKKAIKQTFFFYDFFSRKVPVP